MEFTEEVKTLDGNLENSNPEDFIMYKLFDATGSHTLGVIKGIPAPSSLTGEMMYFPHVSYNLFSSTATPIPLNAVQVKNISIEFVNTTYCGSKTRLLKYDISSQHDGCVHYFIHDNGGRPFLVFVTNINTTTTYQSVFIYCIPPNTYFNDDEWSKNMDDNIGFYQHLIIEYSNVQRVFIGKGSNQEWSAGNSILVKLCNSPGRYCYIGSNIYEFTSEELVFDEAAAETTVVAVATTVGDQHSNDYTNSSTTTSVSIAAPALQPEEILNYYSLVGNSNVPYPVAMSTTNIYFMLGGGDGGVISKNRLGELYKTFTDKDFPATTTTSVGTTSVGTSGVGSVDTSNSASGSTSWEEDAYSYLYAIPKYYEYLSPLRDYNLIHDRVWG